ncbi:MAG: tyrosine-type recombinase/integrase [Lachnospiraceae bacterium]|nr:tyrosine-type recombinase/integrase [Lachnospiraceae bacterium]
MKPYPKSNNSIREVPLTDELIKRIRPFVDSSEGGCLFHSRDNALMSKQGYRRFWESIVNALNMAAGYDPYARFKGEKPIKGLNAHIFRHNYPSELCYQVPALSTKMIAKLIGDNEKMVLEVYAHIVDKKENIDEAIGQALNL